MPTACLIFTRQINALKCKNQWFWPSGSGGNIRSVRDPGIQFAKKPRKFEGGASPKYC